MNLWTRAWREVTNDFMQDISYRFSKNYCKPTKFLFEITPRCNLKCKMCDMWKNPVSREKELTTEDWKKILVDIKNWVGPFSVNISGGETFLYKDILEIIKFCATNSIRTMIITNGFLLNEELCCKVLYSGLDILIISLDSTKAEVHDYFRGVKGTYERATAALKFLSKKPRKMTLAILTIILKQNLNDLVNLVKRYVAQEIDMIIFQPLQQNFGSQIRDPHWYKRSDYWITDLEKLNYVMDELIVMKKKGAPIWNEVSQLNSIKTYYKDPNKINQNLQCMVGQSTFAIDSYGNVRFCLFMEKVGNYFDFSSPKELWESEEADVVREKIRSCKVDCLLNCHLRRSFAEKISRGFALIKKRGLLGEF